MHYEDAYIKRLHAKLEEWTTEIDALKAKAERNMSKNQMKYQKHIEDLQTREEEIAKMIEVLAEDGEGEWEELRARVENARDGLDEAIKLLESESGAQ